MYAPCHVASKRKQHGIIAAHASQAALLKPAFAWSVSLMCSWCVCGGEQQMQAALGQVRAVLGSEDGWGGSSRWRWQGAR